MGKWFGLRPGNPQDNNHKFSNNSTQEIRQEEMELYLTQLEQKNAPVSRNRSIGKLRLLLGIFGGLTVATTLFFVFDGPKALFSTASWDSVKEEYLALEQKESDPLQTILSQGASYLTNLRSKDTKWSGSMNMWLNNANTNDFELNYSYDIDGAMTKEYSSASMGLSLNKSSVGITNYICDTKSHESYVSFPDYSTKFLKADQYNTTFSSILEAWDVEQYKTLAEMYTWAINSMAETGSFSHNEEVKYTVGNLSTTCNSYEITLTKEEFSSIESAFYTALIEDKANFPSSVNYGLYYLDIIFSTLSEDDSPFITMKVYYKDGQILGRTFSLLTENHPYEVSIGLLPMGNEYAFSLSVAKNEPGYTPTALYSLQFDAIGYNHKYNGTFSFQIQDILANGTFSNFSFDFGNTTFPLNGQIFGNITYATDVSGYPRTFIIKAISRQDQMNLKIALKNKLATQEEDTDTIPVDEMDKYYDSPSSSSYFETYSWSASMDITAKITDNLTFSPPNILSENVANTYEEFSNLVSNEPIETMFNNFYKAINSTTKFTHSEAIAAIKRGYLFEDFPSMSKTLDYYIYGSSYFDPLEYNLDQTTILNPFGDYEIYPYYDETYEAVYGESYKKELQGAVQIAVPDAFDTTLEKAIPSLGEIINSYTNVTLGSYITNSEKNVVVRGNIFTGPNTYTENNYASCTQSTEPSKDAKADQISVYIYYDTLNKKIYYVSIEFYSTQLLSDTVASMAAELAHVLDPSNTIEEYLAPFKGEDSFYSQTSDYTGKGQTTINMSSYAETSMLNGMQYRYTLDFNHKE